jgi:hypothetical protein
MKVIEAKGNAGYDALKGEVVADMIAAGIVDPVKVTRTGLERAASAAAILLTTEAAVAEEPKEKKMGGGMPQAGWEAWATWTTSPKCYNKAMITLYIVLGIVVLLGLWAIFSYNHFVTLVQRTKEAWADIDVQLKRRYDLIPNLVETVKGYATHEREAFENVTRARSLRWVLLHLHKKVRQKTCSLVRSNRSLLLLRRIQTLKLIKTFSTAARTLRY